MTRLNLLDTMPFGKHKGSRIDDILKSNPDYLVWFRQTRKDQNADSKFFGFDVSALLDIEIDKSANLKKKFQRWNLIDTPVQVAVQATEETDVMVAYNGWGQF